MPAHKHSIHERIEEALGMARIVAAAAAATQSDVVQILGRARVTHLVIIRRAIAVVAGRRGFSSAAIGRALQRDHTTILHAVDSAASAAGDERVALDYVIAGIEARLDLPVGAARLPRPSFDDLPLFVRPRHPVTTPAPEVPPERPTVYTRKRDAYPKLANGPKTRKDSIGDGRMRAQRRCGWVNDRGEIVLDPAAWGRA